MMKKMCTILTIALIVLSGCGSQTVTCAIEGCENEVYKSGLCPDHYVEVNAAVNGDEEKDTAATEPTETEERDILEADDEAIRNYASSTSVNDSDVGLKNIKFDTAQGNLSDTEKLVAEYFNHDYIFVNSIEALQRYNKLFDNALIQSYVYIEKVISYEEDEYTLLVGLISNSNELIKESDSFPNCLAEDRMMIVHGSTSDSRFIVGDIIQINGRYKGVSTEIIDGVSVTVPKVDVYRAYLFDINDEDGWWYAETPSRFSMIDVKNIAKCIFGDDITIRKDKPEDYGVESEDDYGSGMDGYYDGPCLVCELDNQTNAKFSKYFFNERYGTIVDAVHNNYEISFSGDFKHFYLFMYDRELESLTLEYYDNKFNKIWKREFENTASATYDITKNNIYLVANNELYIINTETGEDTFDSIYVGDKLDVRKFSTGLLLISDKKADAFMYVGLDGNVLWRADADADIESWGGIQTQYVDNKIIISVTQDMDNYYYAIDSTDGTIIYSGTVEVPLFRQYS